MTDELPKVPTDHEAGRLALAKVIRSALIAAATEGSHEHTVPGHLEAVVLDGAFDLLAVADAIVAAVHAEHDQTVRRMFERSIWSIPSADHGSYRRQVLGEWVNDEPPAPHAYDLGMGLAALPPKPERWRCCVVGCNPILPSESAATVHADAAGHRVAKWPVRSEAGEAKATERNKTGYYDRYNRKGRDS